MLVGYVFLRGRVCGGRFAPVGVGVRFSVFSYIAFYRFMRVFELIRESVDTYIWVESGHIRVSRLSLLFFCLRSWDDRRHYTAEEKQKTKELPRRVRRRRR